MTTRAWLMCCLLWVAGCVSATPTSSSVSASVPRSTSPATTSTSLVQLEPCPLPDVVIGVPPESVSASQAIASDYGDLFTSIPGTSQIVFANDEGEPAMVVVRGSLPPTGWVGATERFEVREATGALGPLADGMWALAWAESPDRCDAYSIFIYPPGTVDDARRVAESIR